MSKKKEVKQPTEKRGRPVIKGSARQLKLAKQAKILAEGGTIERGRPSDPKSKRQLRLAAQAARVAAGGTVTVGRPKGSGKPKAEAKPKKEKKVIDVLEVEFTPEDEVVDFKPSPVMLK